MSTSSSSLRSGRRQRPEHDPDDAASARLVALALRGDQAAESDDHDLSGPWTELMARVSRADPERRTEAVRTWCDAHRGTTCDGEAMGRAIDRAMASPSADRDDDETPIVVPDWPAPPDPDAYHGVAGDIVLAIEPHTESDPVAILVQLLIGFGNLIGRTAHVVLDGSRHHGNDYVGLVGDSAIGRKGTSWSHARRTLTEVDPTWATDHIKGGLSTGEGLIYHVRERVLGEDPNTHEEIVTDPGVDDKRLLIVETELGSVLKRAGQSGSTLTAVIRQAYDGDTMGTLTRNNALKAIGAHVSIIGHITPEELDHLLSRVDVTNGFANRFLWIAVRRSKSLPFGGALDLVDFGPMHRRVKDAAAFARGLGRMDRDGGADRLWAAHYERLTAGRPGALGSVVARATAHVMRLALVYACLDRTPVIQEVHLRAAMAIWDYAERSAAYIFGESLGNQDADRLLTALRAAAPAGLTRNEIREDVFRKHKSAAEITRALQVLAAAGMAYSRPETTAGRTAERWFPGQSPRAVSVISAVSLPPGRDTALTTHTAHPQDDESDVSIRRGA